MLNLATWRASGDVAGLGGLQEMLLDLEGFRRCCWIWASWDMPLRASEDVAGFGLVGTRLWRAFEDVAGFGLVGTRLWRASGDVAGFGGFMRCCWSWASWDKPLGA